jgi:antirestriction protein
MERTPQQPHPEPPTPVTREIEQVDVGAAQPPETESWDERIIREGIEAAVMEGRAIDNRTARYIASQLHDGQASALYALASSGAVLPEVFDELDHDRVDQPPLIRRWLACLTVYCSVRGESGPAEGWAEDAEAQDSADLMGRISRASVITLGEIATIHTPGTPVEDDEEDDNAFPWGDAARWSPSDDPEASSTSHPAMSAEQLDELFGEQADEEIGDVSELGWYGLVRESGRPGGLVLQLDGNGIRHVTAIDRDDALTTRWASITNEYGTYYEQRTAYEEATDEPDVTPSGINSKVWVGSLADYANGDLHGEWFDATCEPAELELAAKFMLRLGRTPNAEEWGIFDYDGFAGAELGEYESFETVSRIARGVAEHGEAFGHWAAYVGSEATDEIERFGDHYRGKWESFEAYVRDYLEETEFYRFLDEVPEDMRGYIEVDVEQIAQDWSCDYYAVELTGGRVAVFDARG